MGHLSHCECEKSVFDLYMIGEYIPYLDCKATLKLTLYIGVTVSILISLTLISLVKSYKFL